MSKRLKLMRVTTASEALNILLKNQLAYLSKVFNVVAVATPGHHLKEVEERERVQTIGVSIERDIALAKDLKSLIALYKVIRAEKPDILHANTPKASLLSMLAGMFARTKVRIYTVTGLRFEGATGIGKFILVWMERVTCFAATHVVAEGQGVKRTLLKYKITRKPISIIGNGNINGLDANYWQRSNKLSLRVNDIKETYALQNTFNFIFAGRVVRDKGINELVAAFEIVHHQFPNTRLLLMGEMEEHLDPLEEQTLYALKNKEAILYLGFQKDVRPYLMASQVFVLPSYREGFPNVLLQSQALGLPCICTLVNGADEVITPNINGTLIPIKNTQALADAMLTYCGNEKLIEQQAANARKSVIYKFNQLEFYTKLKDYYFTATQEK
jgi:glycosyltransferase involved in cell wall biosynthesis